MSANLSAFLYLIAGVLFILALRGLSSPATSRQGKPVDYRLSFESARALFADLTPARIDLLETLRQSGPCSVYALAKAAGRNYSNVHTDIARLEELGLVERDTDDAVFVPYESVEILVPLARVA